jgi:hypothetical protein
MCVGDVVSLLKSKARVSLRKPFEKNRTEDLDQRTAGARAYAALPGRVRPPLTALVFSPPFALATNRDEPLRGDEFRVKILPRMLPASVRCTTACSANQPSRHEPRGRILDQNASSHGPCHAGRCRCADGLRSAPFFDSCSFALLPRLAAGSRGNSLPGLRQHLGINRSPPPTPWQYASRPRMPLNIEVSSGPFARRRDGRKRKQDHEGSAVQAVAQRQQDS